MNRDLSGCAGRGDNSGEIGTLPSDFGATGSPLLSTSQPFSRTPSVALSEGVVAMHGTLSSSAIEGRSDLQAGNKLATLASQWPDQLGSWFYNNVDGVERHSKSHTTQATKQRIQCIRRGSRTAVRRRGAALLLAIFIMTVVSMLVVAMADTQTLRYAALRNTRDWDDARYLAEAGLHHALSQLEADIDWRAGIGSTEFPVDSGHYYSATVQDGPDATVIISATGLAGSFSRVLTARIKHGG